MVIKKSQLYSSLWKSCDELRGGMDASQYKDYILTLLFVKYVTDKQKADPHSLIDVPAGGSFDDILVLKGDKEIGDKINKVVGRLADANGLKEVLEEADFNNEEKLGKGKEMQDRLSKLVAIFGDLDFRNSRAQGDDLLGDAYEYLMRHFATESGKSKGQFYTPAEVSRVLAKIVGIGPETRRDQTVYDPTCGSGSLLLKVADEAPNGISIYGQEKDNATWALARMNMILHGNEDAEIAKGDTITSPEFMESDGVRIRAFDFAVANPPFSVKSWSNGLETSYDRFEFGMPPQKNGDYAFLLHTLKSLKSTGKAAIILPHGVLFRGNAEASIRRRLIDHGYIKGIIGLPPNLFYGTGIPACIVVLDKEFAAQRDSIFMVDASRGFIKDGAKNRLRSQDIHKIVDVFNRQFEVDRYSRMVPKTEIADARNDYNLNIPRYIDSSEPDDLQDLHAHLHGGIPNRDLDALNAFWEAFPTLRHHLFKSNRPGYSDLTIDVSDVQQAVLDSTEFKALAKQIQYKVDEWYDTHRPALEMIGSETIPNALIATMGDDLLDRFRRTPLLDEYDIYEQLMSYWHDMMHDDVFLIMNEGWLNASRPRPLLKDRDGKFTETPDLVIGAGKSATRYKMDLISPSVLVAKYFTKERDEIGKLNVQVEATSRMVEEYIVEHTGEEGLLIGAMDDDRVTRVLTANRFREAKHEGSDPDEIRVLQQAIHLFDAEATAKTLAKGAQSRLDTNVLDRYGDLSLADVQSLVLENKWSSTITHRIAGEVSSLTLVLVARIQQLGERYGETVEELDSQISELEIKIAEHLADMGVK